MNQTDVGGRIAKRRKEKGLTQLQLAESLNVSNRTVSKWETGDGYPDITILPALSNVLDISIDELVCGEKSCDEANTVEIPDNVQVNKVGASVLKIVSFGLVIFAAILGISTELTYYRYRAFFLFPIETYIVLAAAVILAAGVIMYCLYVIKYKKSKSLFEWPNYWMTVLASSFPAFLFFRCSHWFMTVPEGVGFFVFYSYIIALVASFIVLMIKHKSKKNKS